MAATRSAPSLLALTVAASGGAVLAGNGDIVVRVAKEILAAVAQIASRVTQGAASSSPSSSSATSDEQIAALALQVQELSKVLHQAVVQQGGLHRVSSLSSSSSSSRSSLPVWASVALVLGAMRLSGVSPFGYLFDSFFVSKAVFKRGIDRVGSEVSGLADRIRQMRSFFSDRVDALDAKQEECAEAVEKLRASVADLGSGLETVDAKIDDLSGKQEIANRGIGLLCRVVMRHLSKASNAPGSRTTTAELEHYLKDEAFLAKETRAPLPGLKELLDRSPAPKEDGVESPLRRQMF